jgi:hypothetical protein
MPWYGDTLWFQLSGLFVIVLLRSFVGTSFQILHQVLVIYMTLHIAAAAHARLRRDFMSDKRAATPDVSDKATAKRDGRRPRLLRSASRVRR